MKTKVNKVPLVGPKGRKELLYKIDELEKKVAALENTPMLFSMEGLQHGEDGEAILTVEQANKLLNAVGILDGERIYYRTSFTTLDGFNVPDRFADTNIKAVFGDIYYASDDLTMVWYSLYVFVSDDNSRNYLFLTEY